NFAFVYDTPRVTSSSAAVRALLDGWQLNGIASFASGMPFTVNSGRDNSFSGIGRDTADLVGNPARSAGADPVVQWFNPSAFIVNAIGTYGNVGRNSLRGPGLARMDLAVFRNFKLSERIRLQFRAESFNIANHANFGVPTNTGNANSLAASVSAANFGRIT